VADDPSEVTPLAAAPQTPADNSGAKPAAETLSKEVLKSAYNAFKKRWKLTRLDQESRVGRGPMSSGQKSTIVGIQPPNQFPTAVWEALVNQGRLKYAGSGQYALP
jgi:hypothetical protein